VLGLRVDCDEQVLAETARGRLVRVRDRRDSYGASRLVIVRPEGGSESVTFPVTLLHELSPVDAQAQARICAVAEEAEIVGDITTGSAGWATTTIVLPARPGEDADEARIRGMLVRASWAPGGCDMVDERPTGERYAGPPIPRTSWLAPPPPWPPSRRATADDDRRVCDAARAAFGASIRCATWAFPSLATQHGAVYFTSTDTGSDRVLWLARDGRVTGGKPRNVLRPLFAPLVADAAAGRIPGEAVLGLLVLAEQAEVTMTGPFAVATGPDGIAVTATQDTPRGVQPWWQLAQEDPRPRQRLRFRIHGDGDYLVDHGD
jgi:hypothetical protein